MCLEGEIKMAGKRIFNWKVILIVCIFLCGITEVTPHVTVAKGKMKTEQSQYDDEKR